MSGSAGEVTVSDPFYELTGDDRTALVVVFALLFAVLMVFCILLKLGLRYKLKVRVSYRDVDFGIFAGAVLMIAQTACVVHAANRGLGKHRSGESVDLDVVRKSQYAATVLGLVANYCAKLSTCLLIKNINDYGRMQMAIRTLLGFIAVTFAVALATSLFRCPLPEPWVASNPSQCPSIAPIFRFNGAMNILTDVLLCVLAVAMVWNLQAGGKKKSLVIFLFTTRILCPITIAPSLTSSQHLYHDGDFTFLGVTPTSWQQVSYNLSIITACIPNMRYIFESLSPHLTVAVDTPYDLTRVAGGNGFEATAIKTRDGSGSGYGGRSKSGGGRHGIKHSPWSGLVTEIFSGGNGTTTTTIQHHHRSSSCGKEDDGQSESVQNLRQDVIVIKEEVEVHVDDHGSGGRPSNSAHGAVHGQGLTSFHAS